LRSRIPRGVQGEYAALRAAIICVLSEIALRAKIRPARGKSCERSGRRGSEIDEIDKIYKIDEMDGNAFN